MRKGSEIYRYRYVEEKSNSSYIYHMWDIKGRALLCDCSRWIKIEMLGIRNKNKVFRKSLRKNTELFYSWTPKYKNPN